MRRMVWVLAAVGVLAGCGASDAAGPSGPGPGASPPTPAPATTVAFAGRPSAGCSSATGSPGSSPGTTPAGGSPSLDVNGTRRTYELAAPPGHAAAEPLPLVLEFHGFGGSGAEFAEKTKLPEKGTAAGMIVVSPDGTDHTWQLNPNGTDAAYITALLDHLEATRCVDLDRVYLTGFSAGAAFTIAYSCAHQDRVAAIATGAVDFLLGCQRPLSILAFHGTKDPLVPYEDGAVGLSLKNVAVRGSENNLTDWATLDGCAPAPQTEVVGTEVTRETWTGCADGTEVVFNRIEGGGHTWPGSDPTKAVGLTTQQIDASAEIVRFFGRHPSGR